MIYATILFLDQSENKYWLFLPAILTLFGYVFDITLKLCLSQLVGSVAERFHRSTHQLSLYKPGQIIHVKENVSSGGAASVIQRSMELLEDYKNIHQGLGPLLFLAISTTTALLITCVFITIKMHDDVSLITNFLYTLNTILSLFYLIQICDDCHEDIRRLKETVR
jgi:hypothetical protein